MTWEIAEAFAEAKRAFDLRGIEAEQRALMALIVRAKSKQAPLLPPLVIHAANGKRHTTDRLCTCSACGRVMRSRLTNGEATICGGCGGNRVLKHRH